MPFRPYDGDEKGLTPEQLREMTLEQAQELIAHAVYDATELFVQLAAVGKVWGNGCQARLNIAEFARKEIEARWNTPLKEARHKLLLAQSENLMKGTEETNEAVKAAEAEAKRLERESGSDIESI